MFFRTFGNRLRHAGMDFSNTIRSKLLPALAAFALFFVVSAAYFAPQFRGEALPQHDVIQYEGMAKDISDMRAATGEDPQWTGGMFGGMPAYLINVAYPAQLVKRTVGQVVKIIDTPAGFLFFAMVSMWLMLLIVGINPWVGIVAALAYGLSTYFLLIIGAGHVTKMWALVYAPLMMGGAWMTLRGNMWAGGALTALTASLEIGANHPQITYYFLVAMAAFWISEGIVSFREKRMKDFALRTAALAAAGGEGEVLFDLHGGSSAGHGVLKHAADVSGTLMLAQAGDIHTVNDDLALIHRPHTGNSIEHRRFARTIAADHSDKIALIQLQVQAVQGSFLVDRASVKGLGNVLDLKHFLHPPLPSSPASRSTCPSSTARQGKQPPQKRSAA